MSKRTCPHGGYKTDGLIGVQQPDCGLAGWLCDMCKRAEREGGEE